ncbi:MAG: S1C family serine protease [bacterium]|nr:S1C family serine protease [bacterium]
MSKWFERPSEKFWKTVVLAVVVGAAGGALGAIAVWSSLLAYQASLLSDFPFSTISSRSPSVVAEREVMRVIREEASVSVADIFLAKPEIDARYFPEEAIGRGVVLTSDGWILTHRNAVDPRRRAALRVGVGAFLKTPEKIVEDTETGTLFIKISGENLRAAVFGNPDDLQPGDTLFAPADSRSLFSAPLVDRFVRKNRLAFSDQLETFMVFGSIEPSPLVGSPLVDSRGKVIGIITSDEGGTRAMPINHITSVFASVFNNSAVVRPVLGVYGLHLTTSRTMQQRRDRGFLITNDDETVRAVLRNSPAEQAGLKTGDIILRIRDQVINGHEDLAELLAGYPGETVDLTVMRGETEMVVPVKLGTRDAGKVY